MRKRAKKRRLRKLHVADLDWHYLGTFLEDAPWQETKEKKKAEEKLKEYLHYE